MKTIDAELMNETTGKLNKVVMDSFMMISRETGYSTDEIIETLTSVNLRKLHDSVEEAMRQISEAVDLNRDEIYDVLCSKRHTDMADIVSRLHQKSRMDRGNLSS